MQDVVLWLLTVEALGLAAFPLAARLFRGFPDRGYGLSKAAGLLLIGFLNFWLGNVFSLANYPLLLWCLTVLLALAGLWAQRGQWPERGEPRRVLARAVLIEEVIFLLAFAGWTAVRMQNPDIYSTEKPMDFMLLQVSGFAHHFPPPDAWLSGHTVSYYYLGYAIFAMLGRMAGVDPRYGFNLANITIFALGCSSAYAIGLALLRRWGWALGAPMALMLAGDYDGFGQTVTQVQSGTFTGRGINLFCSTRIIGGGCGNYRTITEFPIFSLIWNDLHPHVMAIPFALLAIAAAANAVLAPPEQSRSDRRLALAAAALIAGALYPINSWDFPTYLVLLLACQVLAAERRGWLNAPQLAAILAVIPAALLLYLPYYLTVHISGQGIGIQANPTDLREMLTVIGPLLLPAATLAAWQASRQLGKSVLQRDDVARSLNALPRGWGYLAVGLPLLLLVSLPARADLLLLLIAAAAVYALLQGLRDEPPATLFAVLLVTLAALVLLTGDYVYLRDVFAGGPNYRMNTIFKLYYQAWLLLAFATTYGVAALWQALAPAGAAVRTLYGLAIAAVALPALIYPVVGIPSQSPPLGGGGTLDGLHYLSVVDPGEYQALIWIRTHTPTDAVIADATGIDAPPNSTCGEYWVCSPGQVYNKVSALTGRPTLIGWPSSHEALWRGAATNPAVNVLLQTREAAVRTLYTTLDTAAALRILHSYAVQYVYVGPVEQLTYVAGMGKPESVLAKFHQFLPVVFQDSTVTIYRVPR